MAAKKELILSAREWQFMTAVWLLKEADAARVSALLRERYGRFYPPKTAGIFLARLVRKGLLQHRSVPPIGPGRPAHVYFPAVTREDALRRQFQRFVEDYGIGVADMGTLQTLVLGASGPAQE